MDPVTVKKLYPADDKELLSLFVGNDEGFMYFGDEIYLLPKRYLDQQDKLRQMKVRKDDVWLATFPRSGKVGGWQKYFDEEMSKEADEWIAQNLEGTDILFPHLKLNPSQLNAL